MAFTLTILTDNAAFADGPDEVARLLRETADRVAAGDGEGSLRDVNGNTVGEWTYPEDEESD